MAYTIRFANEGTVEGCDVNIIDSLPADVSPLESGFHNFTTLVLKNASGEVVQPINRVTGDPITEIVNITYNDSTTNSSLSSNQHEWIL
ncbi:MAG: hypothetical protein H6546_07025 [Chitinophagales bacterium]|nr:hypothetical protein [Chitinophagales bacterium]